MLAAVEVIGGQEGLPGGRRVWKRQKPGGSCRWAVGSCGMARCQEGRRKLRGSQEAADGRSSVKRWKWLEWRRVVGRRKHAWRRKLWGGRVRSSREAVKKLSRSVGVGRGRRKPGEARKSPRPLGSRRRSVGSRLRGRRKLPEGRKGWAQGRRMLSEFRGKMLDGREMLLEGRRKMPEVEEDAQWVVGSGEAIEVAGIIGLVADVSLVGGRGWAGQRKLDRGRKVAWGQKMTGPQEAGVGRRMLPVP
ncbi:hypothetical protein FNV43_RR04210 [Rhamnella rubrinervis]|uniref:Uncharacterized protein n=1 Tax=Rhamnella rubrinervis TaxID=2594499 RepID=A0A8K0MPU7_9ROSA|nr:hypothetical protein FNV43_RR04210 [Rhamnella rubrinervis]